MDRDIYIVSVPRGVKVQEGPNARGRPASAWRLLSRAQVRKLIAERVNGGCVRGAKVFIETRAETAMAYTTALARGRKAKGRK